MPRTRAFTSHRQPGEIRPAHCGSAPSSSPLSRISRRVLALLVGLLAACQTGAGAPASPPPGQAVLPGVLRQIAAGIERTSAARAPARASRLPPPPPVEPRAYVMIAIDRSVSADLSSGIDIDGDGRIDTTYCHDGWRHLLAWLVHCEPSRDSLLSAQVKAVRELLQTLDLARASVGLLTYSGDSEKGTPDAEVIVPLTDSLAALSEGLGRIHERGAEGRTNLAYAIQTAKEELERSSPPGSERRILCLGDGMPTLPSLESIHRNRALAFQAAQEAGKAGIVLDTYDLASPPARHAEELLRAMAQVTTGRFYPAADLAQFRLVID